jgi:hypothetical protein
LELSSASVAAHTFRRLYWVRETECISTTVPAACNHGSSSSTHHPPASEHKQEDEEKQTI